MTKLNNLLQILCEADIEFVIVGGFAAVIHGSSMLTRDLDVCTVLSDSAVGKLRNIFRDLHPIHRFTSQRLSFLDNPEPGTTLKNLYLQTDLGPIDFLSTIDGIGNYDDVMKNAEEIILFDRKVHIISLPDLLRAKETLGREKDIITAKELRAIMAKKNPSN
jgi:predicted nucleotidyltransferase